MIAKMSPRPFARGSGVSSLVPAARARRASTVAAPAAIRTPRRRGARARGAVRRDWDAIADGTV